MQQHLRRDHLELRRFARGGPSLLLCRSSQTRVIASRAPAIQVARSLEIELAVAGDRRAEAAAIQLRMTENFPFLLRRFDDVKTAFPAGFRFAGAFAAWIVEHRHIKLAVGEQRT